MLGRQIPISQLTVDAACPLEIGDWRVLPPPLYVPHLVVSIKAPQEVSRGGTLRYEVTILNSSGTPYGLEPCPVFVQQLAGQAAAHQLNCAVPTIKAHSSVRFEMRVSVPSNTSSGGEQAHLDGGGLGRQGRRRRPGHRRRHRPDNRLRPMRGLQTDRTAQR